MTGKSGGIPVASLRAVSRPDVDSSGTLAAAPPQDPAAPPGKGDQARDGPGVSAASEESAREETSPGSGHRDTYTPAKYATGKPQDGATHGDPGSQEEEDTRMEQDGGALLYDHTRPCPFYGEPACITPLYI